MSLPKLTVPTYTLELPSTKQEIKYRPFLVKEEKLLLIAMQDSTDGNNKQIISAVKDVIVNCTFDQVDVSKLTTYDLEYLFLQLRIKSRGSVTEMSFKCNNTLKNDDGSEHTCGHVNEIDFDLTTAKIVGDLTNKDKKIILEEATQIGVIMKEPTFESVLELSDSFLTGETQSVEDAYALLPKYIDTVFQGEETFDEFTDKEILDWLDELTEDQKNKIESFFDAIPKLSANIEAKCSSCGYKEQVPVEGLANFLA